MTVSKQLNLLTLLFYLPTAHHSNLNIKHYAEITTI